MSGLRIEADVETDLSGEALAALLRGVAAHYPHEFVPAELAAFGALADAIAESHRPAASGLRGTVRATPHEAGAPMGPLTVAHLYGQLLGTLREATARPGAVVEVQVSVVLDVLDDTETAEISTQGVLVPDFRAADDSGEECDER